MALNQVLFLKIPAVRTYFKIPAKIKHDEEKLPVKKKPFVAGVKESEYCVAFASLVLGVIYYLIIVVVIQLPSFSIKLSLQFDINQWSMCLLTFISFISKFSIDLFYKLQSLFC